MPIEKPLKYTNICLCNTCVLKMAGQSVTITSLICLCKGNPRTLAEQLMGWGLIPHEGTYMCPHCGSALILNVTENCPDKLQWVCHGLKRRHKKLPKTQRHCRRNVSLRTGTFFERSKLTLLQILSFVNFWVSNIPLTYVCKELRISRQTAVDWASFCREVVLDAYILHKQKLGGEGKIVEIDESKFGRRKYHRGHSVEGQWVFGGYERGTGRVFMVPVEDRSANTLIPIIRDWIEEKTTIISDYWRAYDCLQLEGYEHLKVNHSINFKDPDTGAHTNAIESSWRAAKSTMSSSGRRKSHIPGNLARYMFQKRCAELELDRTVEFFRLAGRLYNPLTPREFPGDEDMKTDDSD